MRGVAFVVRLVTAAALLLAGLSGPARGRRLGGGTSDRAVAPALRRRLAEMNDGDRLEVIVGWRRATVPGAAAADLEALLRLSAAPAPSEGLRRVHAARARLTRRQIRQLLSHQGVDYVEEDHAVHLDGAYSAGSTAFEIVPYNIRLAQGGALVTAQSYLAASNTTSTHQSGACSDPDSLKVAVVDSGADVTHPDLPCRGMSTNDTNCIGKEFGVDDNEAWYAPRNPHGTHVLGVIGARRRNGAGIVGMVSEPTNICYLIAQVFGADGGTKNSAVLDAVEWAVQQGARIINLSLGSATRSNAAALYFSAIREAGVLTVGAAGNDGSTDLHYPASYASVISVGSVDANLRRSAFSQHNRMVDIAAPGAHVLSTFAPDMTNAAAVQAPNRTYVASLILGTGTPGADGISGALVPCPDYGLATCPGPGGHVCLVERGATSFAVKAVNCVAGGGSAVVIYNNLPQSLLVGSMTDYQLAAPVLGMSAEDAAALRDDADGDTVVLRALPGYAVMDGTSMAAPHVAGAAAELWARCPRCGADAVERCLLTATRALADSDYDYGLLQARSAFMCLVEEAGCCSEHTGS